MDVDGVPKTSRNQHKDGESKLVVMEALLNDAREMAQKEVESTVMALQERLKRSETEVEELKTQLFNQRREAESRFGRLEAMLQSLLPKVDSLETEVERERALSRATCRQLQAQISILQRQNQDPDAQPRLKQKLRMSAQLPMELIGEILSWLPATSLLRCRLVCISWLVFISSTRFKQMHLHNSNKLNPRSLVRRFGTYDDKEVYNVHFNDEALTVDGDTLVEFPFNHVRVSECIFRIVGCCNGVICLSDDGGSSNDDNVFLWNPSIRRMVILTPPLFCPVDFTWSLIFGFGYDRMSDDYKVVRLAYESRSSSCRPQVEVYSVNNGMWRAISFPGDLPCFTIPYSWSQVFFNGCVHWLACNRTDEGPSRCSIMTFDISSELFGEIQLPECLAKEESMENVHLFVAVIGECLAVIRAELDIPFGNSCADACKYTIWVMKEYKKSGSWRMVYEIESFSLELRKALRSKEKIVECRDEDFVIHDHNMSYHVYPLDLEIDYEEGSYHSFYVDRYQESLGLLDAGYTAWREEDTDEHIP